MTETTTRTRTRDRVRSPQESRDALPPIALVALDDLPAWTWEIPDSLLQVTESGWARLDTVRHLRAWLDERGLRLSLLHLESLRVGRGLKKPRR